jgi:DNA-binding NtrC family response regulator
VSTYDLLPAAALVIGRTEECDVVIDDASVSRSHARIHGTSPPEIEDLGSRNGTRVAGAPIPKHVRVPVPLGGVLHVGDVSLVVVGARSANTASTSMVGESANAPVVLDAAMRRVYALVNVVGPSSIPVLILGETGTGKEVLAEAIHRASPRVKGPFLRLNCASLPESLLESELFGHERGAFTGAVSAKQGLLESADGGTVLLDEVGEMPLATQAKLLRVLESGEVMRVGSLRPKQIDVRIISATNRDLQKQIGAGAFRSDLFFRLNGITFSLPPLRARRSETLQLARRFARDSKHGSTLGFSSAAERALEAHSWPGNVRELKNVIERAVVLSGGGPIDVGHLLLDAPAQGDPVAAEVSPRSPSNDLRGDLAVIERARIIEALEKCAGNQSRAAKLLGISRGVLIKRLDAYGLTRPRKKTDGD